MTTSREKIALQRAQVQARRRYRSKQYRDTYLRGALAALRGGSIDDCPYRRRRGQTWAVAWRNAWIRGFQSIEEDE